MKNLLNKLFAVLFLLQASCAFAENVGIQNEALKTLANTAGTSTLLATDKQGRLILNGSFNGVYAEDSVHVSGDRGQFVLGVANNSRATLAADGDYTPLATNTTGALLVNLDASAVISAGNQPVRLEDAAFANSDAVMMSGGINNGSGATTFNTTNGDVTPLAVNRYGGVMVDLNLAVQGDSSGGTSNSLSPIRREDDSFGDLNAGMAMLGVNARSFAAYNSTNGDLTPLSVGDKGVVASMLMYDSSLGGASSAIALEDDPSANAQAAVVTLGKILAVPTAQAADADWGIPMLNDVNAHYTDGVRRGTFTHSNPSVTTATSTTLIAANTSRRYLLVQNNSAANICISLNAAALTGIVPSNTNPCIVIAPGGFYESPPNACPTAAVTGYQTSGGTITTITTVEAS